MLVSFFAFYAPTCRELLELHYRCLEHRVDHFVITESSLTHAGHPAPQGLDDALDQANIPRDRVTVIRLEIPTDQHLEIQEIDRLNSMEVLRHRVITTNSVVSQRARSRERLQKDSVLTVLNQFPDDTVFLHSDCDEIINPAHLDYLISQCCQHPEVVIKIPLVYLQGRADLRVHHRVSGDPVPWDGGMFLAMKSHFARATPTQIRSNNFNPFPICHIAENGQAYQDLGWHFSWMGTAQHRLDKTRNFAHHSDDLSFLAHGNYASESHHEFVVNAVLASGEMPPSGDVNHVLRTYDTALLPQVLWQLPRVQDFLLPHTAQNIG